MQINENYRIERDRYNYILVHTGEYVNQTTGEITYPETRSYYPDLASCCRGAVRQGVDCDSLDTILASLERLEREIVAAIMLGGVQ